MRERTLYQFIERRGMKQGPPVCGNAASFGESLGFPTGDVQTGDGGRERTGCVIADIRSSGSLDIRTYRATDHRQRRQGRDEREHARFTGLVHVNQLGIAARRRFLARLSLARSRAVVRMGSCAKTSATAKGGGNCNTRNGENSFAVRPKSKHFRHFQFSRTIWP